VNPRIDGEQIPTAQRPELNTQYRIPPPRCQQKAHDFPRSRACSPSRRRMEPRPLSGGLVPGFAFEQIVCRRDLGLFAVVWREGPPAKRQRREACFYSRMFAGESHLTFLCLFPAVTAFSDWAGYAFPRRGKGRAADEKSETNHLQGGENVLGCKV